MMDFKTLRFSVENQVGLLTLNRPEALNALNQQLLAELQQFLETVPQSGIRALVITGAGEKAFVAGADIKEMESLDTVGARAMAVKGQKIMQAIEDLPMPVIAAVNGFALGGGLELALACDFIVASTKARWGLPEVTLGLIPGYGGTQRLARLAGRGVAKRVALSGEIFTAAEGLQWGVFTQTFEPPELLSTAQKIAATCASRAPRAMAWVKEAVARGSDHAQADGMKIEADLFAKTFETKDQKEGVKAFIEKRPAHFTGH